MTDQDSRLSVIGPWIVPEHIDVCATCGYQAWRDGYPCNRCGGLESIRFVPQLAGAVVVTDAGIVRAERWMLNEMHDGLTNRECIDAILNALRGQ